MTSKWIIEFEEAYDNYGDDYEEALLPILERIDKLLRRAAASTESETLLDSIQHELEDWS